jgi:protease-4
MAERTSGDGFFARWGRRITTLRNFIINAGFILVLFVMVGALLSGPEKPDIADGSALFIEPSGTLVEQIVPPSNWQDFLFRSTDEGLIEIGDVLDSIHAAAADPRIRLIVVNFDQLMGLSSAQATRIGEALQAFRGADKQVLAYTRYGGQYQYLASSYADEVFLHPMGMILLTGLGGDRLYFADLLEKLKVQMHVFRVGDYKSATEPFSRNDMSPLARQDAQRLVDGLWMTITDTLANNRGLSQQDVRAFANTFDELLADTQGDGAQATLQHNLVDGLMSDSAFNQYIGDIVGWQGDMLNGIDYQSYLMEQSAEPAAFSDAIVGVLTVQGLIVESGAPAGDTAVADELVEQIRMAKEDERIKALVLRVDSPGGSAFGSELIREELASLKQAGKPVVASFGSVAASGGYWISATADAIFAEPTTITGSIGIFGLVPNFSNSLDAIGVNADGVASAPLARGMSLVSELSPQAQSILQLSVEHGYQQFLDLVVQGRNLPADQVAELAQGRIWSGLKAKEIGLVDSVGSLDDAVSHAAQLAQLSNWSTEAIRPPLDPQSALMMELMQAMELPAMANAWQSSLMPKLPQINRWLTTFNEDLKRLEAFNDPRHIYAMCMVCSDR